ncbi:MAG: hypothetical protein ACI9D0_001054 [Bacteroidia bacterium]|jgi:hypothetical protein
MLRTAALVLLATAASSCGWHAGLLAPTHFEGVTEDATIGVEIFGNETPEPGLEADFAPYISGALVDFVAMDFEAADRADLIVKGTLTRYRRRNGIRSQDNQLLEGSVRIEVTAELILRSTGEALATANQGLWADWATGTPGLGAPGIGEIQARERLLQNLADRLVLDLFTQTAEVEPAPTE